MSGKGSLTSFDSHPIWPVIAIGIALIFVPATLTPEIEKWLNITCWALFIAAILLLIWINVKPIRKESRSEES